jgi:hypothetical protein
MPFINQFFSISTKDDDIDRSSLCWMENLHMFEHKYLSQLNVQGIVQSILWAVNSDVQKLCDTSDSRELPISHIKLKTR